jgi:hypothetical protein
MPPIGAELSLDDRFNFFLNFFRQLSSDLMVHSQTAIQTALSRNDKIHHFPPDPPPALVPSIPVSLPVSALPLPLPPPLPLPLPLSPVPSAQPTPADRALDELMDDERWGEALAYNSGAPMPHDNE